MPREGKKLPRYRRAKNLMWAIHHQKDEHGEFVRCIFCNLRMSYEQSTMEHLKPKSKGGTHRAYNILPACKPCNSHRGNSGDLSGKFWGYIRRAVTKAFRENRIHVWIKE